MLAKLGINPDMEDAKDQDDDGDDDDEYWVERVDSKKKWTVDEDDDEPGLDDILKLIAGQTHKGNQTK